MRKIMKPSLTNGAFVRAGDTVEFEVLADTQTPSITEQRGETCPQCNQPALIQQEGCNQCTNCGYSKCG